MTLLVFKVLLARFVNVCRVVEGDTTEAEALFRALYRRVFDGEELDLALVAPVFEATIIDAHDVIDLILLTAMNMPLNADACGTMYWAAFLLVCMRDLVGKRLMHCMETRGFVCDTDFASAAHRMGKEIRPPTVWDHVQNYTNQLCVALTQPEKRTIAGVYNSIIDRCRLPEPAAEKTATMSMLRKLLRKFYAIEKYKARIRAYVAKNIEQSTTRTIYLNGSDEPVVLDIRGLAETKRTPVFSSPLACVKFALACAQDMFLSIDKTRPAEWYMRRFQCNGRTRERDGKIKNPMLNVQDTTPSVSENAEVATDVTKGGFTSIEDRDTASLLRDMQKGARRESKETQSTRTRSKATSWRDVIEEESSVW